MGLSAHKYYWCKDTAIFRWGLDASSDGYDDDNSCRDEDDYYAFLREMAWWLSPAPVYCVS